MEGGVRFAYIDELEARPAQDIIPLMPKLATESWGPSLPPRQSTRESWAGRAEKERSSSVGKSKRK